MTASGNNGIGRSDRLRGAGWSLLCIAVVLMGAVGAASGQTLGFQAVAGDEVDCGGTVDIDVMVDDIPDLRGYSLFVQFDPAVVSDAGAVIGPDFAAACAENYFYKYDAVSGVLRVDASLLGCSLSTTEPKSLLRITFEPGATKATSSLVVTGATILRDSGNNTLSYTPTAGSIANICNTAPVVTPATFGVDENSAVSTPVGTVLASDIDTVRPDVWTFAITDGNTGDVFVIDANTGAITVAGALDFETTAQYVLTVEATDDDPNTPKTGSATVTIDVNDVNEAPVLAAIGDRTVDELVELSFTATAGDVDAGATLTFSLDGIVQEPGMAITAGGAFTWTPTEAQGPGVYQVKIIVSDGTLTDDETITITVGEVNLAPVLGTVGNQAVAEETQLAFAASATDADLPANTLVFSLDAPAEALGMAITPGGNFTWTPNEAQGPGIYAATITVSDGDLTDVETISITVTEVNVGPTVGDIPDQTVAEGAPFATINLDDYVTDPDHADNLLTWAATGMTFLTVDITDRVVTITAPADWNGSEIITFTATDPGALSSADAATFTVTGVNDPPTVTTPADQTNTVLDSPTLQIVASDIDGDDLTYGATGLPNGLTIDANGLISGSIACGAVGGLVQVTVTDNGIPVESTVINFNWTINPIDTPAVLAGLTAARVTTGNDADGTTKINLTWTVPTDTGANVRIYRKAYGGYPLYNASGAVPTLPVDGTWTLVDTVPVDPGAYVDEPATRDFWYYTAVVANSCGDVSAPTAVTGGTLNYHLGDVTDGSTQGAGNNLVNTADITLLGSNYAQQPGAFDYLDIGPTTDYRVWSRPTPDNILDFEDLILMAINFGAVSKSLGGPEPADRNELLVFVPEEVGSDRRLTVSLWLTADGTLKGTSIPLVWNASVVKPIAYERGGLVAAQDGQGMLLSPAPGTVDFALFGAVDGGISGEGLLATVTFEVLEDGDAGIGIGAVKARDLENKALDLDASVTFGTPASLDVPMVSVLHQNFPNPFNPTTTFKYGVAVEGRVSIEVYDVRGRLVTTLLDEVVRPGSYEVIWDGNDSGGRRAASGVYLARFKAVDKTQMQRMTLLK